MSSDETQKPDPNEESVTDEPTTDAAPVAETSDPAPDDTATEEAEAETAEVEPEQEPIAENEPKADPLPPPAVERAEPAEIQSRFPWKILVTILVLMALCGLAFFYLSWSGVLTVSPGPADTTGTADGTGNDLTTTTTATADPTGAQAAYGSMILTVSMMVAGMLFLAAVNTALIIVIVLSLRKMIQAIARLSDSLNRNDKSE